jgi:hypothetical protein
MSDANEDELGDVWGVLSPEDYEAAMFAAVLDEVRGSGDTSGATSSGAAPKP